MQNDIKDQSFIVLMILNLAYISNSQLKILNELLLTESETLNDALSKSLSYVDNNYQSEFDFE